MSSRPKWLDKPETTRARSSKQEKKTAKKIGGFLRPNSGATLKQNDVYSKKFEVECKTTTKNSHSIDINTWEKLLERSPTNKTPIMVIQFEKHKDKQLAVIDFDELLYLLGLQ